MKRTELKEKMSSAIEVLEKQINSDSTPDYVKAKAAATMGKLIGQYLDLFDTTEKEETGLRSVKDF